MWPLGGDGAAGEQLFIGACDVIAESKRAPVKLSTSVKPPRHCDVTASSTESLMMTSLGHDVIYAIHSGLYPCVEPIVGRKCFQFSQNV